MLTQRNQANERNNDNCILMPEYVLDGLGIIGAANTWLIRTDLIKIFLKHHEMPENIAYMLQTFNTVAMFHSELPHNRRRNRILYQDFLHELPNRIPLPMVTAFFGACATAIIQSIILYESEKDLFANYENPLIVQALQIVLISTVTAGVLQEFAHGGMELFTAAIKKRPLFYNGNLVLELIVNPLFSIGSLGEAAIFYGESSIFMANQRKWGIKMFSLVSAVMNLSENHEVVNAIKNYNILLQRPFEMLNLNLLNAVFHGISRYQMISHIMETTILKDFSSIFSPTAAVTLGLTKWLILESANHDNFIHHDDEVQLPYTGYQHGIDINYCLIFYGILQLFKSTSLEGPGNILISNIAANFLTEAIDVGVNYFFEINTELDERLVISHLINIVLAPLLVAATYFPLISYLDLKTNNQTNDYLEHSTPVLVALLTIIYKHLFNKLFLRMLTEHRPDGYVRIREPENPDQDQKQPDAVEYLPINPVSADQERPHRISFCEKVKSYFPSLGFFSPVTAKPNLVTTTQYQSIGMRCNNHNSTS